MVWARVSGLPCSGSRPPKACIRAAEPGPPARVAASAITRAVRSGRRGASGATISATPVSFGSLSTSSATLRTCQPTSS
jgi:hypothetical protein